MRNNFQTCTDINVFIKNHYVLGLQVDNVEGKIRRLNVHARYIFSTRPTHMTVFQTRSESGTGTQGYFKM